MEDRKRACIAMLSKILVGKNEQLRSVYDYKRSRYCMYSSSRSSIGNISIYDYDRSGYLQGRNNMFYDFPSGNYIQMRLQGNQINGYDYSSGYYFVVVVNQNSVSIYDYERSNYFNYIVN